MRSDIFSFVVPLSMSIEKSRDSQSKEVESPDRVKDSVSDSTQAALGDFEQQKRWKSMDDFHRQAQEESATEEGIWITLKIQSRSKQNALAGVCV